MHWFGKGDSLLWLRLVLRIAPSNSEVCSRQYVERTMLLTSTVHFVRSMAMRSSHRISRRTRPPWAARPARFARGPKPNADLERFGTTGPKARWKTRAALGPWKTWCMEDWSAVWVLKASAVSGHGRHSLRDESPTRVLGVSVTADSWGSWAYLRAIPQWSYEIIALNIDFPIAHTAYQKSRVYTSHCRHHGRPAPRAWDTVSARFPSAGSTRCKTPMTCCKLGCLGAQREPRPWTPIGEGWLGRDSSRAQPKGFGGFLHAWSAYVRSNDLSMSLPTCANMPTEKISEASWVLWWILLHLILSSTTFDHQGVHSRTPHHLHLIYPNITQLVGFLLVYFQRSMWDLAATWCHSSG